MMPSSILAPAAILILWSLVVLMWLTVTRFPAFTQAGIRLGNVPAGSRYADVEAEMPSKVNWVSHNYSHLLEQPTIFYAVIAVLALAGDTSVINVGAAWAYAVIRIMHSIWQGTVNLVPVRLALFTLSTLCLWILAINAVRITAF